MSVKSNQMLKNSYELGANAKWLLEAHGASREPFS
jgi:hypothetical protein